MSMSASANIWNRPPLVSSVLHPTDFSAASERAFANALAIALFRETRLTLLHVHGKGSSAQWSSFPHVRQTLQRWGLLEEGSAQADVHLRLNVDVEKVALESSFPAWAIGRYLDAHPHDLIVLATEGEAGLPSWFSRSTSETIAGLARTPALFVPAGAERGLVALDDGAYTLRRILVPVDHRPDSRLAVELATRAAGIFGDEATVEITLFHVGTAAAPWPSAPEGPGWRFRREQVAGDVVEQILQAAERYAADLVVMATAGEQNLLELVRGSTTDRVLRRARCPVLTVPCA
jgi:nucleotide-binding universal stress UspA family protein